MEELLSQIVTLLIRGVREISFSKYKIDYTKNHGIIKFNVLTKKLGDLS